MSGCPTLASSPTARVTETARPSAPRCVTTSIRARGRNAARLAVLCSPPTAAGAAPCYGRWMARCASPVPPRCTRAPPDGAPDLVATCQRICCPHGAGAVWEPQTSRRASASGARISAARSRHDHASKTYKLLSLEITICRRTISSALHHALMNCVKKFEIYTLSWIRQGRPCGKRNASRSLSGHVAPDSVPVLSHGDERLLWFARVRRALIPRALSARQCYATRRPPVSGRRHRRRGAFRRRN